MSHFDGDTDEMPVPPLDDRALEALLSGAPQPQSGFDWLVPFVEDLGAAASGPAPATKPALAMLLAQGFSTEKGDLPATAASNVTGPAPQAAGLPKWRKKMLISELLAGLVTKLAGLGMAAKAGMGLTLAAASTTAAGAVGVLPAPAQHAVATVVEAATPFSFPDEANDKSSFGATVSADASGASDGTPGVDGKAVSDAAKAKQDAEASTAVRTDANSGAGVGANTGATGLDRANQTPAAGHAPTSVPAAPGAPGSQASKGLDTANSTPAAGNVPTSVPPVTPAVGNPTGLTTAGSTPAAGRVPATPGRP
jgi:hypothetical protein